ncbi:MAG: tetratricopeptide repeat protein [Zoogloeaceae bacterium]|jgi:Tfp pilus assembly protein PilF|nr:tetratricopeptide repeat protein [Zoogloeaceae bacterium]
MHDNRLLLWARQFFQKTACKAGIAVALALGVVLGVVGMNKSPDDERIRQAATCSVQGLASHEQGDYAKALAELLKACGIRRHALGKTHPDTMDTKASMGITYPKTAAAKQKPFAQWLEEALR